MKYELAMFLCALISTSFISLICFYPEEYVNKIPSIIKIFIKDTNNKESYKDYIPIIPKDPIIIWKLSRLEHSLVEIEKKYEKDLESKKKFSEEIIKEAKELIGEGKMNSEILHKFPEFLETINKNTIWSRIVGFYSFTNLIWMIAILGIIISIGPALLYLFGPIMLIIFELCSSIIFPIIVKLYEILIILFIILYNIGFFDVFAYFISIILIADGMKLNKEYGFYISLTGASFYFCLVFFHNYLYDTKEGSIWFNSEDENKDFIFKSILITITFFSLSLYYNSILFSFATVLIFYCIFGFYTKCYGLCYVIGFEDKNSMLRIIINSFILLLIFIIIRALNINNEMIELYRSPIQIFGTFTYFLGLLIISSIYYVEIKKSYVERQIIFVVSLLVVLFVGNVYDLPSLTNTAYVFGALYLMEKNVDFFMKIEGNIMVMILILSLFLWWSSLYLHRHPKIIISIISGI